MRVCLIHGSTQSSKGWDLLVPELVALGANVMTVDLPLDKRDQGANFYGKAVASQFPGGEPPVVVAHSAAGMILPSVAAHVQVERLVYLAAVVPEAGASLIARFQNTPEMFQPEWPGKDPTKDPELARHFLFHDCDSQVSDWALTTLRLWNAPGAITESSPHPHPAGIPVDYISCTLDRTINPSWWEAYVTSRLAIEPIRMEAGHCPHVSKPRETALYISAGPSRERHKYQHAIER